MARASATQNYAHAVNREGNIQYTTTLPEALGRRLEQEAAAQHRSTANFLLHMVGLYFEAIDQEGNC